MNSCILELGCKVQIFTNPFCQYIGQCTVNATVTSTHCIARRRESGECQFMSILVKVLQPVLSQGRRNCKKCWWGQAFVLDKICLPHPDWNRVN